MIDRLPIDEARLLPHLRTSRLEQHQATVFADEHARALAAGITPSGPRARSNDHLMTDPQDLRGIPVVARGVPGASPGTRPDGWIDRAR